MHPHSSHHPYRFRGAGSARYTRQAILLFVASPSVSLKQTLTFAAPADTSRPAATAAHVAPQHTTAELQPQGVSEVTAAPADHYIDAVLPFDLAEPQSTGGDPAPQPASQANTAQSTDPAAEEPSTAAAEVSSLEQPPSNAAAASSTAVAPSSNCSTEQFTAADVAAEAPKSQAPALATPQVHSAASVTARVSTAQEILDHVAAMNAQLASEQPTRLLSSEEPGSHKAAWVSAQLSIAEPAEQHSPADGLTGRNSAKAAPPASNMKPSKQVMPHHQPLCRAYS